MVPGKQRKIGTFEKRELAKQILIKNLKINQHIARRMVNRFSRREVGLIITHGKRGIFELRKCLEQLKAGNASKPTDVAYANEKEPKYKWIREQKVYDKLSKVVTPKEAQKIMKEKGHLFPYVEWERPGEVEDLARRLGNIVASRKRIKEGKL